MAWDVLAAQATADLLDRFKVCLDATPCVEVTLAASRIGTDSFSWKLPATTIGAHTVTVAACNPTECGDAASLAFVLSVKPALVKLLRIGH